MSHAGQKLLNKIYSLNNHVILFKAGNYIFVTEGLFSAIGGFFSIIIMLLFQANYVTNPWHWLIQSIFIVIFGFIGSRSLSALASFKFKTRDPKKIKYPGFMYHGALIGGLTGTIIFAFLFNYPILALLDFFLLGNALTEGIGKFGCFTYGCCWGRPTKKWWGVTYKNPLSKVNRFNYHRGEKLYPTQLWHASLLLILFGILLLLTITEPSLGLVTSAFFIIHSTFRLIIEYYRADTTKIKGNLTLTGLICFFLIIIGLLILSFFLQPLNQPLRPQWWVLTNPYTYLIALAISLGGSLPLSIHYKRVGSW